MAIGSPLPKLHYAMQVGAALTLRRAREPRPRVDHPVRRPAHRTGCRRRAARTGSSACSTSSGTAEIGGKTELAECMKDFVTQNKRRGLAVVISDFYDPQGFEQGINTLRYYKFEPFVLQVYDLREAEPEAARRPRAGRLRDRRDQGGHGLEVAARGVRARAREVLQGARGVLHQVRDAVLPHPHVDPVRRARAQDLPLGRLPAVSFLGPIPLATAGRTSPAARPRSRSARTSSRCGGAGSRCRSRSCGSACSSRRTPTRCGSSSSG